MLKLTEICDGVFLVNGRNKGRFPFAHCFLIIGDVTALIDTGCGHDLLRELKEKHRPDIVINSHSHPDHACGNGIFEGIDIIVPKIHAQTSGKVQALSERFISPEVAADWRRFAHEDLHFSESEPTGTYDDGHIFDFGKIKLLAVHAPGHLDDHFCFFEQRLGILLSFDIDFSSFGPWYGNPESDIEVFKKSIRQTWDLKPAVVVSSHRTPIRDNIDDEFKSFLDKFERNASNILALLRVPKTFDEILEVKPIYRKHPWRESVLRYFEGMMIEKHLNEMELDGLVLLEDGRYWTK